MIRRLRSTHGWIFLVILVLITVATVISVNIRPTYPNDSIPDELLETPRDDDSLNVRRAPEE